MLLLLVGPLQQSQGGHRAPHAASSGIRPPSGAWGCGNSSDHWLGGSSDCAVSCRGKEETT